MHCVTGKGQKGTVNTNNLKWMMENSQPDEGTYRFGETLTSQWSLFAAWLLTQDKFIAFMLFVPLLGVYRLSCMKLLILSAVDIWK